MISFLLPSLPSLIFSIDFLLLVRLATERLVARTFWEPGFRAIRPGPTVFALKSFPGRKRA